MSKRPTDHLEPSAKKRAGDRQISREQPPSDSDDEADEVPLCFCCGSLLCS